MAKELGFPIKIVRHVAEEVFTELARIKEKPLSDMYFEVWRDFEQLEPKEMVKALENKVRTQSTPTPQKMSLNPYMTEGYEFRILLKPGTEVTVKSTALSNDDFTWYAVPFHNGMVPEDLGSYVQNGQGEVKIGTKPGAGLIAMGVNKGETFLEVEWLGVDSLVGMTESYFLKSRIRQEQNPTPEL